MTISWRRPFLIGLVASATVVVGGVELLTRVSAINRVSLTALGVIAAAIFVAAFRQRPAEPGPDTPLTRFDRSIVLTLMLAGACTLIVAMAAPPNHWDAMTYHMARVAQWYDHGTVAFYPTPIDRQLWQPPFAEYIILVGYAMLGGLDYLANVPQWIAYLGVAVAAMEIARLLGASRSLQLVAAAVVMTTPIVVLESSSAQNDLLAALWLSIAAYFALSEFIAPKGRMVDASLFGAAFGLAIGTKGTALPIGLPWLLVFLAALRPAGIRTGVRQAALAALTILALNAGQYARNLDAFDNPLGPTDTQGILRPASLAPLVVVSNLAANASIHLGTPSTRVNAAADRAFAGAHTAAGLDLNQLYPYFGKFRVVPWSNDEGQAGNPLQFLLGIAGFAIAVGTWRGVRRERRAMILALAAGILLVGMTIRWQPFNGRLHLPLFVLGAPCIALLLGRLRRPWLQVAVAVLTAGALPSLIANTTRPLIPWATQARSSVLTAPREEQYFASRPSLHPPYAAMIQQIKTTGCSRIGLFADYDSWEYPLWVMGKSSALTFVHEGTMRGTTRPSGANACAWIGLDPAPEWRPPTGLHAIWHEGPFSIWR